MPIAVKVEANKSITTSLCSILMKWSPSISVIWIYRQKAETTALRLPNMSAITAIVIGVFPIKK